MDDVVKTTTRSSKAPMITKRLSEFIHFSRLAQEVAKLECVGGDTVAAAHPASRI